MMIIMQYYNSMFFLQDQRPFRYLQENVIRLTDIESLTSLHLLSAIADEHERILLNTHLQVGLWDRMSWLDLSDDDVILEEADCPAG